MNSSMQQLIQILVDKGVHIKSAGVKGEKYVYKYVKYFRNQDGQPRIKARSIDKISDKPGMMIPNGNYFQLYKASPFLADWQLLNYFPGANHILDLIFSV